MLRATLSIYRLHARQVFGSRRNLVALLLVALPPLAAFLITQFAPSEHGPNADEVFGRFSLVLLVQVVTPLVALLAGVAVIAEEVEARTITYPFTRPIPRAALLFGRWLATLTLLFALLVPSVLLTALFASGREGDIPVERVTGVLGAVVLGAVVYSAGAAVVGVLFKRALIVALGYAFAIEGVFSYIPGSVQKLAVQHYLRALFFDESSRTFLPFDVLLEVDHPSPAEAAVRLGILAAVLLVFGVWLVRRRQFVLPA